MDSTAGLRLDGLFCYPGHIGGPAESQSPLLVAVSDRLDEALNLWANHGLQARIVSGGSSPSAQRSFRFMSVLLRSQSTTVAILPFVRLSISRSSIRYRQVNGGRVHPELSDKGGMG